MKCSLCGCEDFEILKDEVDIGVGNLEHITGGRCNRCGEITYCNECGNWQSPDGEETHSTWCKHRVIEVTPLQVIRIKVNK